MTLSFVIPEFNINGAGTPPLQFFRRGFNLNGTGGSQPSWKDIILHGNTALTLVNSKAGGLNYLKLFGGTEQLPETYIDSVTLDGKCEQSGTPTPTQPVDIVCNNGTIKYSANMCNVNAQTALVGYYISTSGVVTADVYNWIYQDFIPVKPNTTYTLTMSSSVYYVSISEYSTADNSGFVVRKAGSTGSNTTLTITTGSTTNYIRFGTNLNRVAVTLDAVLAIDWMLNIGNTMTYQPYVEGGIYTDGTVETVTDNLGNVATAQMLLSAGDYKDTQKVLTGSVTRNIGIKVLDGTEGWVKGTSFYADISLNALQSAHSCICNYYAGKSTNSYTADSNTIQVGYSSSGLVFWNRVYITANRAEYATANDFKQFLAEQYSAGTPVIVIYPLATATTETVTPQFLLKEPLTVTGSLTDLVANVVSSSHTTPTPTQPLPINTNNGVLTFGVNKTYTTADGQGTFVSPNASTTTRIYKAFGKLKVGKYKVKITGDFEFILQYKDAPDKSYTQYGNIGTWTTGDVYEITDTSMYYGVAIRNAGGSGNIYPSNFNNIGSIGYSYLDVTPVGTVETVGITGKNLLDLANCVDGYYYDPNGVYSEASPARLSNFVKVKANKIYTVFVYGLKGSANVRINLFDTNKTWLSQQITPSTLNQYTAITVTATQDGYLAFSANFVTTGSCIDWSVSQIVKGSYTVATMPEYEPYYNGGSATAEMLLKVGDYQDVQSVLDGEVTRNIGVKVLDGTENWQNLSSYINISKADLGSNSTVMPSNSTNIICSHFETKTGTFTDGIGIGGSYVNFKYDSLFTTLTQWKQWLSDQYNAGQPVIIVYPLATATTETVTAQPLTIQAGSNVVEITQASMDNLELEVSYKAGVEVTVEEVEAAQLSNDVTVTVS